MHEMELFAYGMTERGYAPACQPKGVIDWQDFDTKTVLKNGKAVWSVIWYDKLLTDGDLYVFQLVRLPDMDKKRTQIGMYK